MLPLWERSVRRKEVELCVSLIEVLKNVEGSSWLGCYAKHELSLGIIARLSLHLASE